MKLDCATISEKTVMSLRVLGSLTAACVVIHDGFK